MHLVKQMTRYMMTFSDSLQLNEGVKVTNKVLLLNKLLIEGESMNEDRTFSCKTYHLRMIITVNEKGQWYLNTGNEIVLFSHPF